MSTATAETSIPEPIPVRSDERKIARNRALLLLGHEGVMLDKVQQQARYLMDVAKGARDGTLGKKPAETQTETDTTESPDEEDQMGVNIGNETHFHLPITESQKPTTPAPAPAPSLPAPVAAVPAAVATANPLLGALMGGALVLGGAAVGALWPDSDPPATVNMDTDTDTLYQYHLPP